MYILFKMHKHIDEKNTKLRNTMGYGRKKEIKINKLILRLDFKYDNKRNSNMPKSP